MSKLILFGENSLRRVVSEFLAHYHWERPHQGKGNVLLFRSEAQPERAGEGVICKERLGGLLRYYCRAA